MVKKRYVEFDPDETQDEITVMDGVRAASRGKVPRTRRGPDKLNWKDWIGWVLAIMVPVVSSMLWTWNQASVAQVERAHILSTRTTLVTDYNEKIEALEQAQQRQWQVFSSFMTEMRNK